MAKVLGYGIIGCGYVCERHINAIKSLNGAKLVAVSDINKDKLKETASKFNIEKYFTDYNQLINLKEINVVIISLPDYLHKEVAIKAAQVGKHVCLEKPIARTLQEANEIIDVCKNNNVKLFIAQSMRFYPAWQKAKQLIKSGQLGKVFKIKAKRCDWWDFSQEGNKWRFNPKLGNGILGDMGVHYTDSIRYLLEADPIFVYAEMEKIRNKKLEMIDNALLLLRFPNNIIAEIDLSASQREIDDGEKVEIYGTEGTLIFKTLKNKAELYSTKMNKEFINLELPSSKIHEIWRELHRQFMECINKNNPCPVTGEDGYKALEIIFAAYRSNKEKRAISLPL